MKFKLEAFQVKRFRSLQDVTLAIDDERPVVICGENNIGKTNFLRAMNRFFNEDAFLDYFNPSEDLPNHIYYGSRGGSTNCQMTASYRQVATTNTHKLTAEYRGANEPKYKLDGKIIDYQAAQKILIHFKCFFVEANNINLPEVISEILDEEVLYQLDKQRGQNRELPMVKLKEFIEAAEGSIKKIEARLNKSYENYASFDGTGKGKKVKINFAQFEKLREAIRDMTSVTIDDGSQSGLEQKGSGAQRAVLLTLIDYISTLTTKKHVIWALDEPEVFLQPKLQKQMFKNVKELAGHPARSIVLTTHSQHFVDLHDLNSTHLFKCQVADKAYVRKGGRKFFSLDTRPVKFDSQLDKILSIKDHLGVESNDGWDLLPQNVLVEGLDDKLYLEACFRLMGVFAPNFLIAGGAGLAKGYLQFSNKFSEELSTKPEIFVVLDEDHEGRPVKDSIRSKAEKYKNIRVKVIDLPREIRPTEKVQWTIEDFVPFEGFLKALNVCLANDGYEKLPYSLLETRQKSAYQNIDNLTFCDAQVREANENKKSYNISSQSKKMLIAKAFFDLAVNDPNFCKLSKSQRTFLKKFK